MSVETKQTEDLSTKNADWGTLVILLVVVIIGLVIAWVTVKNRDAPQPAMALVNTPQAAAPVAPTMPPASLVPASGRSNAPGMQPAGPSAPGAAAPETPSSAQAPGNGINAPMATPGGPGGMGGAPNGSSAGPSGTAAGG